MPGTLIPIVALMIPMVVVPTSLAFKHARRRRELDHIERIKALELGIVPPSPGPGWPTAVAATAIGVLVPLGSFGVTLAAVEELPAAEEIWSAPVAVSLAALFAAWRIFAKGMAASASWQVAGDRPIPTGKPAPYDPDAYDFVGSRG